MNLPLAEPLLLGVFFYLTHRDFFVGSLISEYDIPHVIPKCTTVMGISPHFIAVTLIRWSEIA